MFTLNQFVYCLKLCLLLPLTGGDLGILGLASMNLETAQVQIKLRYSVSDSLLHVGIERARNLAALFIPENRKMCVNNQS